MDFSRLYPKALQTVKCVPICVLCMQDTACVCDLFGPQLIQLFMHNWPSFSEFPLHFQVFRGPDFLGTVYLNSPVFRDHIQGQRIFCHKTVSNLHALNIFSHPPFHVTSFCVHCNCKKILYTPTHLLLMHIRIIFCGQKFPLKRICLSGVFLVPVDYREQGCPVLVLHTFVTYLHFIHWFLCRNTC
jgi:hypothetical protein